MASTTLLNRIGAELAADEDVHAVTDVTGFGILGHALEMARGSARQICLRTDDIAWFSRAAELVQQGFVTGASHRNWASYSAYIALPDDLATWRRHLLTDPQTSGGLLVSCKADRAAELVQRIAKAGYPNARIVGFVTDLDEDRSRSDFVRVI